MIWVLTAFLVVQGWERPLAEWIMAYESERECVEEMALRVAEEHPASTTTYACVAFDGDV